MTYKPGMEVSPEAVHGVIRETFELANQYVRDNEHRLVSDDLGTGLYWPKDHLDVFNPNDPEGTRLYLSRKAISQSIAELSTDHYEVDELFVASHGLYCGLDGRYDEKDKIQTGFSLVHYKNGAAVRQHFDIPGAFRNDTYHGTERRLRVMQKTGNVIFHKGADDAYKLRTMNILYMMQRRIEEAQ